MNTTTRFSDTDDDYVLDLDLELLSNALNPPSEEPPRHREPPPPPRQRKESRPKKSRTGRGSKRGGVQHRHPPRYPNRDGVFE